MGLKGYQTNNIQLLGLCKYPSEGAITILQLSDEASA